ncbi:STAS domain-containing protein [Micromonospora sp. SH-82]|uniref:STAS domain-containing protein n=1 Tax=Micromonospora sp. SH-82 TaxID=3132938 RepID=UPI003EBB2E60
MNGRVETSALRPAQPPATELVEVALTEPLDRVTVDELGAVLDRVLALRPARLVIDLTDCAHVDAAGISLLLDAHRRMWSLSGRLILRGPSPRLRRLFHVARVDQVLHVVAAPPRAGTRAVADPGAAGSPAERHG